MAKMRYQEPAFVCCFCGKFIPGYGNNPWPENKQSGAQCCDECNLDIVIPARLEEMNNEFTKR